MDDQKPLPDPFIVEFPKPRWCKDDGPPPGEWAAWDMAGVKGWTLKVWPVFGAQIRWRPNIKKYDVDINDKAFGMRDTLQDAQEAAEQEIVRRVRGMLPAYRAIHKRVAAIEAAERGAGCRKFRGPGLKAVQKLVDGHNAGKKTLPG